MTKFGKIAGLATIVGASLAMAAPASAATVVVTGSGANTVTTPGTLPLILVPLGGGAYTGGSSDTITSAGSSTRIFHLDYDFAAPADGDGSISFTTTSTAPGTALLALTGATFNNAPVTLMSSTGPNGEKTYFGSFIFNNAMAGDLFTLTLDGTVKKGGTLSTSLSYAAVAGGVPEPASWALMIGGVGMAGGALRRRQRTTAKIAFA